MLKRSCGKKKVKKNRFFWTKKTALSSDVRSQIKGLND